MFCAEHELQRSKSSYSSGIRKLTSIPFYTYMEKKNKTRKSMEIIAFKDKSCILPVLTFCHFDLNILC